MDEKDEIIIEFITKFQSLAFKDRNFCFLCLGPGYTDKKHPQRFKPKHSRECLFSRAETAVLNGKSNLTAETLEFARNIIARVDMSFK